MLAAIGNLLPLAVGVAISPLPIIALIVLLMGPRAGASSAGFLLGWMLATAAVLAAAALVAGAGLMGTPGMSSIVAVVKMVLGAILLLLAVKEWRQRPPPGVPAKLPHWLAAVEEMNAPAATGMGFMIYLANPKNLALGAGAGVTLGQKALPVGDATLVGVVYVFIAASTVLLPIVAYAFEKERMRPWLDELRGWLTEHNAAVMAVVLGLMGSVMLGKGIAAL